MDYDDLICDFKNADPEQQITYIQRLNLQFLDYQTRWPVDAAYVFLCLSHSADTMLDLIRWQPHVLDYFPTLKALWKSRKINLGAIGRHFHRRSNEAVEAFLFRAFVNYQNIDATYFFMCRGFSVAGTDDRYYNWTTQLEAKARCYRATLAVLGIARFRRRDILGLVAKALWSTRGDQRWEIKF